MKRIHSAFCIVATLAAVTSCAAEPTEPAAAPPAKADSEAAQGVLSSLLARHPGQAEGAAYAKTTIAGYVSAIPREKGALAGAEGDQILVVKVHGVFTATHSVPLGVKAVPVTDMVSVLDLTTGRVIENTFYSGPQTPDVFPEATASPVDYDLRELGTPIQLNTQ